ncbi:MAG: trafficking protein Mon1-domain-containing protein [Olpidium bornovanus]|uniref:Vacuolar fusion protein MON1 n=1 Tax=Olpidium bornovanus TaxID=278681 RepID=A0A8H8DJ41_9FUNG|nr:MAG: trafficking protein Mon1-domain-containing protein [Olpidium bornovanus]
MPTTQQARGSPDGANGGSAAAIDSRGGPGPGEPAPKRGVGQRPHAGTSAAGDSASAENRTAPRLSLLPSSPERDPAARPRPSSAPAASSSRPQSPLCPPAASPPVSCGPTSSLHAGAPHHPTMTLLRKAGPSTQLSVVTPAKPEYSSSRTLSVQSFSELMDGLDLSNSDVGYSRLQLSAAALFSPADHERDSTSEAAGTAQDVDIVGPGGDSVGAVSGVVDEVLVGLSDSRPSAARRDGSQSSARQSATSSRMSSVVTPSASPVRPESIAVDSPLVPDEGGSPRRHSVVESSPRPHSEEADIHQVLRSLAAHTAQGAQPWLTCGLYLNRRYGDESKISSHMGVVQAIISFFVDEGDMIRCINAGDHKFVFLTRGHLYLATVARTGETEMQLIDQLLYLYNAIISILTLSQLTRIFERHGNFDLRRLLGGEFISSSGSGTETFIDSICDALDDDPAYLLGAMRCLRMPKELRTAIGESLLAAKCKLHCPRDVSDLSKPQYHAEPPVRDADSEDEAHYPGASEEAQPPPFRCVFIVGGLGAPIAVLDDLHLLFNMVAVSSAFKTGGEYWTPICLPRFNSKGFLHAYVCYILPDVCLLLLTPDKDAFFDLSACKDMFLEVIRRHAVGPCSSAHNGLNMAAAGSMTRLGDALDDSDYTIGNFLDGSSFGTGCSRDLALVPAFHGAANSHLKPAEIGIPGLRHFLYKSKKHVQYTCPHSEDAEERLRFVYGESTDSIISGTPNFLSSQALPAIPAGARGYAFQGAAQVGVPPGDADGGGAWTCEPSRISIFFAQAAFCLVHSGAATGLELYATFAPHMSKASINAASLSLVKWVRREGDRLFLSNSPVFG